MYLMIVSDISSCIGMKIRDSLGNHEDTPNFVSWGINPMKTRSFYPPSTKTVQPVKCASTLQFRKLGVFLCKGRGWAYGWGYKIFICLPSGSQTR